MFLKALGILFERLFGGNVALRADQEMLELSSCTVEYTRETSKLWSIAVIDFSFLTHDIIATIFATKALGKQIMWGNGELATG